MSNEEYLRRTDVCFRAAGPGGPDWNDRFLDALDENGLMLVYEDPLPREDGNDYMAPVPHPEGIPYKYPSWIIPKP